MGRSKKGSVFPHSFFLSFLALPLTTLLSLIRTLRCGDGDGNENVKSNRSNRQNKMSTRASDVLYIFLPSLHDNDMKISNFKFSGGRKQATSKFFSCDLGYGSCELIPRKVRLHLSWNNRNERKEFTF